MEGTDAQAMAFWEDWVAGHPERRDDVEAAARLVGLMGAYEAPWLPAAQVQAEVDKFRRTIGGGGEEAVPGKRATGGRCSVLPGWTMDRTWRVAAVLAGFLVLAGSGYWGARTWLHPNHTISTPLGGLQRVTLPDGSTVALNANSRLRYARDWSPDAPREVWLEGEAYFQATRKRSARGRVNFTVHTDNVQVEVLGTAFDVHSRRGPPAGCSPKERCNSPAPPPGRPGPSSCSPATWSLCWREIPYKENTAQPHLARSPRNEVFAYAADQLARAVALLPDRYPDPADNGRVTEWAARAYLGMVHLQQGHFAQACPHFEHICATRWLCSLDRTGGFRPAVWRGKQDHPESVWQVLHAHWPAESHPYTHWGHWENDWGTGKTASSARNVDVARLLVYQFKYDLVTPAGPVENYVDPRAALTFYGDEGYGGYPDFAGGAFPFTQLKNWYWNKYQRYETQAREGNPDSRIRGQLVRLQTVRLLLAECLIMGGNYPGALAQINAVRERAGAIPYAALPTDLGTTLYVRPNGETDPLPAWEP